MTHREAKFILSAYRPGGQDTADPAFAEALTQVAADPHLKAWHEAETRVDRFLADRLAEVAPPADLRMTILAGARLQPARSRATWVWAMAASLLVLLGVASLVAQRASANKLGQLTAFAAADRDERLHGGEGALLSRARAKLSAATSVSAMNLQAEFPGLVAEGCRTFDLGGRKGIELCFFRPEGVFHLYVVELEKGEGVAPRFLREGGRATVAWAANGLAYALVSDDSAAANQWLARLGSGAG
ncbi:hypothetical protein [Nibricoccus sp. IMCC34717]|uniref:hypothetical protein n=1 Tax=Nibricoccus sp. IMCC34717 TaxID=3034021 RepID=UPI003851005D